MNQQPTAQKPWIVSIIKNENGEREAKKMNIS